ncbi:MAG: family deacetylase [Frankiales bacterium]|nr:family deacetylase [Frankiales bacterium]
MDRPDLRTQAAALGTILGVWAHPDDETYECGALMAAAVAAGSRVVCVTATRGEAGSLDLDRWPPAELADVRTRELEEALEILGVTEHHWLDYPDGGCADVPEAEAVERIVALIADVRPDTVLTFGPDGMTGHADHIAVSRWATLAAELAGEPAPRVHYSTVIPSVWTGMERMFFDLGVSMGGQPVITPDAECSILAPLPPEMLALKNRAVRAQVSQTEMLTSAVDAATFDGMIATEMFRAARAVS